MNLGGDDLYANPERARRDIGYLPEEPPLYGELNVEEYLRFCARLHGVEQSSISAAVEKAIERCELGEMRRRLTSLLSKGFRQRVGLAQAIIHEPALIVLDEPASGLDPIQALRLRELIRTLAEDHAVVLSTHVLSDVLACCDRVAILHQGRLRHSAALSEIDAGSALHVHIEHDVEKAQFVLINERGEAVVGGRDEIAAFAIQNSKFKIQNSPKIRDAWMHMPMITSAHLVDTRRWRIGLKQGSNAGELAKAINDSEFGLLELRADSNALEEIFVRIAGQTNTIEAAA